MRIKRREMGFILGGGLLVLLLFYYLIAISPALSRQEALERATASKVQDLADMMTLKARWEEFKRRRGEAEELLARRGRDFTLLSFLEGVSRKVGVQDKIQYMKPLGTLEESSGMKVVGMEIKLEGIGVEQMVKFLHEIEFSDMLLGIKKIKIQTLEKGEEHSLRVTLQVDTITTA